MDEMLDTFDVNGNFLGVNTRDFCHSGNPGVYHKTVWIWIVNSKKEILVQKRSSLKDPYPSKWDMSSAGHIGHGESYLHGCEREVLEELGVQIDANEFICLKDFVDEVGMELVRVYLLNKDIDLTDFVLQEEEVECVKWLGYGEFIKLLYSEDFSNHSLEYKDWVANTFKNMFS